MMQDAEKGDGDEGGDDMQIFRMNRVFRMLRLLRLTRLIQFFWTFKAMIGGKEVNEALAEHMSVFAVPSAFIQAHIASQHKFLEFFAVEDGVSLPEEARC